MSRKVQPDILDDFGVASVLAVVCVGMLCLLPFSIRQQSSIHGPHGESSIASNADKTEPFPITVVEHWESVKSDDVVEDEKREVNPKPPVVQNEWTEPPAPPPTFPPRVPYEVTVYTASWCIPCAVMKKRDGNGNADIHLTWIEGRPPSGVPESYPAVCWRDRDNILRHVHGSIELKLLFAIIERNNPPPRKVLP